MPITEDEKDKDSAHSNIDPGNKNYEFADLSRGTASKSVGNLDFLLDIPLEITIELGRTKMLINELLKLGQGSVIELSKFAGETLDVLANQRMIAKGEVVVVNDKYGIRLTEIISSLERIVGVK
ncbi:Flagellar motor switch protein FliN (fragment) [uncultured Desulfobacterium sp.]|uniref:Flagellar motor switch protein FliN n=1 Tax=uncultured Desulfobacterium sp. TaxID=201089 RepID=A0A445MTE3_9BACT